MTSSRTGSLEVLSLPDHDSSLKNRRSSSDGFRSPSPSGNAPQELVKSIQTEGKKVRQKSQQYKFVLV